MLLRMWIEILSQIYIGTQIPKREELLVAIDEYIKYYNTTRIVSKIKMSPIDYRNRVLNNI